MSNLDQIDKTITEVDHNIVMGEALKRLKKNPDFKIIITDGYLRDKVLASVSMLAVDQVKKDGQRINVMEDLVSASNLQYFFSIVESFYEGAKNPILSDEEQEEFDKMTLEQQNTAGGVQ